MLWRLMLCGVLMLGVLIAVPQVAQAQIACGASITASTGLTGDLDCSAYPYDTLHVNADNVTFKLNGYTLTCSSQWGWYNTPYEFDVEGIRATGRSGVKILGPGKITNCGRAVTFEGGSGNLVQGLYITGNLGGFTFIGGTNSTARDNVIVRNLLAGIGTSGSTNIQILGNYIAANGGYDPAQQPNAGWGILNDNASTVTYADNFILGHEKGGIGEVGASALAAQITNNIILGNGPADLGLRGTDDVVTGTICETSTPAGLCPNPRPKFPFDPSVATLPGPASPIAPAGTATPTPTFTWRAVASATWYFLWVEDSTGGPKIAQWYAAAEAGCGNGTGECRVTSGNVLALGGGRWWVQTWNAAGYGPWSSAVNFTVSAPGRVTLVAPSGTIATTTPTYTWNADAGATYYYLWVNDSTGTKIQLWYTSAQANCASGTGACTATPDTPVATGAGQWWVQTWNSSGYGPWSDPLSFTVSP